MRTLTLLFAMAAAAAAQAPEPPKDPAAEREERRAAVLRTLKSVSEGLADKKALAETEDVVRALVKDAAKVEWGGQRKEWSVPALALVAAARERGGRAAGHDPPYLEAAARYSRIAVLVASSLYPEELPPTDAMSLHRDADAAVDSWLFGDVPPALPPAKDLLAKEWTWTVPPEIEEKRDKDGWHLENIGETTQVVELVQDVRWADFRIQIEFSAGEEGFVLQQRTGRGNFAAVQHDIKLLMANGAIKAGERLTVNFWIYGGRFRVMGDKPSGQPGRCAPSGARSGGFSFRLPPGGRLHIHKLAVTVIAEEK